MAARGAAVLSAVVVTVLPMSPAGAKVPVDRLTADPTGDFLPACEGSSSEASGPPAMDFVGATALVDPYGDLWLVAQVDGDPEAYYATSPETSSFTWDLDDRTGGRRIQVVDEVEEGRRTIEVSVDGEPSAWPVDSVVEDSQSIVIVTGSGIGDKDEVLWGATARAGADCDEVGGGSEPSAFVAAGIQGGSGDASTSAPSSAVSATTATGSRAEDGVGDSGNGGAGLLVGAAVVAGGVGLAALVYSLLRRRR